MDIIFFGTGSFGIPSLEALKNSSHRLLGIVPSPDKPKGRHLAVQSSPVKEWALAQGLPVFPLSNIRSKEFVEALEKLKADLFVVISFGYLLSEKILKIPRLLCLNVHPSLLPRYRGAAPIHWALIDGEKETGVSVVRMTKELDAGDIALQKKTEIFPQDDIFSLEKKLSVLGAEALLESLSRLEKGSVSFKPQNGEGLKYARKLIKEDGHLDWRQKAESICNRVRAMKQWPTSYGYYEGKRVILMEAEAADTGDFRKTRPGAILSASPKEGILVMAEDKPVRIRTLQLEGKKPMSAGEFMKGFSLKPGAFFE